MSSLNDYNIHAINVPDDADWFYVKSWNCILYELYTFKAHFHVLIYKFI